MRSLWKKSMNKTGTYFTKLKSLNKEQLKWDGEKGYKRNSWYNQATRRGYKKFYTYYAETSRIYERISK